MGNYDDVPITSTDDGGEFADLDDGIDFVDFEETDCTLGAVGSGLIVYWIFI